VSDFNGLGRRAGALALSLTMFLVSLGGVPPLAGFWGKLFVFKAAIDAGGIGPWLAIAMVVNSVISLVYYIGIVRAMYFEAVTEPVRPVRAPMPVRAVVGLATVVVLAVGVFPPLFTRFPPLSTLVPGQ
jgi:NADH-quinone oxidoreductase subunit N